MIEWVTNVASRTVRTERMPPLLGGERGHAQKCRYQKCMYSGMKFWSGFGAGTPFSESEISMMLVGFGT